MENCKKVIFFTISFFLLIVPLISSGVVEITIEYENITTTTTIPITTTTTIPPPGGFPGTTPPLPPISEMTFVLGEEIIMTEGEDLYVMLLLNNTGETDLRNITVKIYGLPVDWYDIRPSYVHVLSKGESITILILFNSTQVGNYTFSINTTSDRLKQSSIHTLVVKEMPLEAKLEMELRRREEEARRILGPLGYLLIVFGVIGPISLFAVFLHRRLTKKCIHCGGKLKLLTKGDRYDTYVCTKCNNYAFIPKKEIEPKQETQTVMKK